MSNLTERLSEFYLSDGELVAFCDEFKRELKLAKKGKGKSLRFFSTHLLEITTKPSAVQVMAIGGSNFHSCSFNYSIDDKGRRQTTCQKAVGREDLPIFATSDDLLGFVLRHLDREVEVLVLNFAYHIEPLLRDGIVDSIFVKGSKEHKFKGLEGKAIGEEIEKEVKNKLGIQIKVVTANDTVCLAFAGADMLRSDTSLLGAVVGTGFNFSMYTDKQTIINTESGDYDGLSQTRYSNFMDKTTFNRGEHLLEKEISGRYLFESYNAFLQINHIDMPLATSTRELSDIAVDGNPTERAIASAILQRSASLIAACIYCYYQFLLKPKMSVIIEGGLFWRGFSYRRHVRKKLTDLGVDPLSITFNRRDQSYIYGALRLVMD